MQRCATWLYQTVPYAQVTDHMAESGDPRTVAHDNAAEAPAIDTEVIP